MRGGERDGGEGRKQTPYQSFVAVFAEGTSENSLDVAKVPIAEMRGADDNVITLHGAAASRAAAVSIHPEGDRPGTGCKAAGVG